MLLRRTTPFPLRRCQREMKHSCGFNGFRFSQRSHTLLFSLHSTYVWSDTRMVRKQLLSLLCIIGDLLFSAAMWEVTAKASQYNTDDSVKMGPGTSEVLWLLEVERIAHRNLFSYSPWEHHSLHRRQSVFLSFYWSPPALINMGKRPLKMGGWWRPFDIEKVCKWNKRNDSSSQELYAQSWDVFHLHLGNVWLRGKSRLS